MVWIKAFMAGFVATLLFHQSVIGLFWLVDMVPSAPWNLSPVPPLGVPAVLSLSFWGGVWGLPVWWVIRRWQGVTHWLSALLVGAIGPTAVAMLVVFPLKGLDVDGARVVGGLIVNGAWGLGVACSMRLLLQRAGR